MMKRTAQFLYEYASVDHPTSESFEAEIIVGVQIQPATLQAISADVICHNYRNALISRKVICEQPEDELEDFVGYELKLGEFRLPSSVSEDLFTTMMESKLLTDQNLQIFNARQTNLRTVSISNVPVTRRGLRVLREQRLAKLKLTNIKAKLEEVVSPLVIGRATESTLRVLSLCECEVTQMSDRCLNMETMSRIATTFRNLVSLSLVSVKLQNDGLSELCAQLSPTVTALDISENPITDVLPLLQLAGSLRSLTMYNLYSLRETNYHLLADNLPELRHLDISCDTGHQLEAFLNEEVSPLPVEKLLMSPDSLPYIVSLDVSGREVVSARLARTFLRTHPYVTFMGLLLTPASHSDEFCDPEHLDYTENIRISSLTTDRLILDCFKRYSCRPFYLQKALVALFSSTRYTSVGRPDLVQMIVNVMSKHSDRVPVQMAATACLYNLTKDELGPLVHEECLKLMVGAILACMANYPSNEQLQKNCLLTLCTDRILMEVNFDKYRCSRLVMDCLCKFEDETIVRMILAIISILAAKITTEETSSLASNHQYMLRLIEITKNKMQDLSTDRTIKFALSAIWNLTDESPRACRCFVDLQGLELAIECLTKYEDIADLDTRLQIQTKVVGLLNNIAEVKELKKYLISTTFINLMRTSLTSTNSEYSYFSGGILANLLCNKDNPAWATLGALYQDVHDEMINAISNWTHPETAMVAYRCFRPFAPLLAVTAPTAVQYWALWAINHVCSKDPQKYIAMLTRDGIYTDIVRISERIGDNFYDVVGRTAQSLHYFIYQWKMARTDQSSGYHQIRV